MPNFDENVEEIMRTPGLEKMRPVVEKEILHYDIFQALDRAKLLRNLVFQGGTSLRLCRGSNRFSEDLDFAGGANFDARNLADIKQAIEDVIGRRYGLNVTVQEPKTGREAGRAGILVDKWQVSVETSPERRDMPRQRIKLEVANIPAYTRELLPLKLNYPQLEGYSSPVFVNTEKLEEIMADKVLAFPASIKPIRHRDIWDLAWLTQRDTKLDPSLVVRKIEDYKTENYVTLLNNAIENLPGIVQSKEFSDQMRRFIDAKTIADTIEIPEFRDYLTTTVNGIFKEMRASLVPDGTPNSPRFRM